MRTNRLFLALVTAFLVFFTQTNVYADLKDFTTLRDIDKGTFNEYRYYMVKDYFKLKEQFELKGAIDKTIVLNLLKNAKTGYNYLPDNLINQNIYNDLSIAVKRGYETPNSEVNYEDIIVKLNSYIEKVSIQDIKGNIELTPISGNAPLTVTFRGKVTDPSGTVIPATNYVWWFDAAGVKKIIGRGLSVNYTFREEGNYAVFLDVKSTHKNAAGYNDVIPFSSRATVQVKEKVASVLIYINSKSLKDSDEIKFTPDEASYGLIFDATSSTPTGGAKFVRTEWDFGNGVQRKYDGDPRIERVIYSREGSYQVVLKLLTNEGNTVERKFNLEIHKPIATIDANQDNGYIGDKFSFNAKTNANEKNLSYSWKIIDINNDKVILNKEGNIASHIFNEKGRYNIQLKVKDAAGNEDVDTKIVYINSRPPIAEFSFSIPDKSKPNKVLLDGSKSYDPDYSDDGKLKYIWTVNGEIINLDQIDSKGAIGYYTFDSVGDHSVNLEVIDPDQMSGIKNIKVQINSILSVELFTFPKAIQREGFVRFVASSQNAKSYEWDFGDGEKTFGMSPKIEHIYKKSGNFVAKVIVKDIDGNVNETFKNIYVGESNTPLAVIGVDFGSNEVPQYDNTACGNGAYIVNRVKTVNFRGGESINSDGTSDGLSYSWKIGNKIISGADAINKFDEVGCFPVKLTVTNNKKGTSNAVSTFVKVANIKPSMTSLDIQVVDDKKDPVVVNVSALGTKDEDGVIQSYLWYYYTDSDIEPQDFRITKLPSTNFVLPKISGNYYFVVVMKDNNEERTSSEDNSSNKYSITLSGDNVNTPLIDFKINKNSLYIGEEAIFTTTIKNVLGQDITKNSSYAWDFDGDGFYDKETNIGNITYKYENSGTFYTKVRVKYKGMTNVRTIEVNVANILEPKFEYISLGDTYLFFNTSGGKADKVSWNLGDGNTINDKNFFTYTYSDDKKSHDVTLKISEGNKSKEKTSEVTIDMRKMLSMKNSTGLSMVGFPEITNGKITLENSSQKTYLYLNEVPGAKSYNIDFDTEVDSDLNGGKDDDVDNKNDASYSKGGLVEILLSDKKFQNIKVTIYNDQGSIIETKDVKIEKTFVKEEEVDMNKIVFNGISNAEKTKIEKLKAYIKELPQEHRILASKYVQKLQEEWFYINEKTKVILEFESFIDSTGVKNATDIINLLESLLVEGQEDQSLRNMAYNVVKNLIPKELVEYKDIIGNLDKIKANPDKLEDNKLLGKKILESIKDTSLIKNEDKITIKSQLQVFIYGSVDKIPQEVVEEVKQEDNGGSNKVVGLLSGFIEIIGLIFAIVAGGILLFFVWYKITNKNKTLGLQDFIIEKTANKNGFNDILGDFASDMKTAVDKKEEKQKTEDLITREEKPKNDILNEVKIETPKEVKNNDVLNTSKTATEEEKVPDWLKGALGDKDISTNKVEEIKNDDAIKSNDVISSENETSVENNIDVEDKNNTKPIENEVPLEIPKVEEITSEIANNDIIETKVEEEAVPDWLKGALGESKTNNSPDSSAETIENEVPILETPKVEEITSEIANNDIIEEKKTTTKKSKKKDEAPTEEDKTVVVKEKKAKAKTTKKEELWDDGMDIPDWLKSANDTNSSNNNSKQEKDFWTLDDNNK